MKSAKKLPASPQAMAQEMMRQLTRNLGPDELILPDDVDALMASLKGLLSGDHPRDDAAEARDEAQELAFKAMESTSEAQARKLATRALRLDPDCVDALVVMTELDARTPRERIEGLQKAVAAGEQSLGAKFIRENQGNFWLLIDTRPYMRALGMLAGALSAHGMRLDAIKVYEKMLTLNPNDNQGVRDPVLALYLEVGDLKSAAVVLSRYKRDASANFAWARVLERLLAGDETGASNALAKARRANRHVELYMTMQKALPKEMPEMYSPGSEEEAVLCLNFLSGAWAAHRDATAWIYDRLAEAGVSPVLSKSGLRKIPIPRNTVQ